MGAKICCVTLSLAWPSRSVTILLLMPDVPGESGIYMAHVVQPDAPHPGLIHEAVESARYRVRMQPASVLEDHQLAVVRVVGAERDPLASIISTDWRSATDRIERAARRLLSVLPSESVACPG